MGVLSRLLWVSSQGWPPPLRQLLVPWATPALGLKQPSEGFGWEFKGEEKGERIQKEANQAAEQAEPVRPEALTGQARPPQPQAAAIRAPSSDQTSSPRCPLNGPPGRWPPSVPPQLPRDTGIQSGPARVGVGHHAPHRAAGTSPQSASARSPTSQALPRTDPSPGYPGERPAAPDRHLGPCPVADTET